MPVKNKMNPQKTSAASAGTDPAKEIREGLDGLKGGIDKIVQDAVKSAMSAANDVADDTTAADGEDNAGGMAPVIHVPFKALAQLFGDAAVDIKAAMAEQVEELQGRIETLEAEGQLPKGSDGKGIFKSITDVITESDVYKNRWLKKKNAGHLDSSPTLPIGQGSGKEYRGVLWRGEKTTILGSTELSPMAHPWYRPGLVTDAYEEFGLVDLIRRVPAPGLESVIVTKETRKSHLGYLTTTCDGAVDGDPTPTNEITVKNVEGFVKNAYCRIWSTVGSTGMKRKKVTGIDTANKKLQFATDDIDFDANDGDRITSEVYGSTAESGQKPYMYIETENVTETMKTIAMLCGITRQRLKTVPMLESWIQTRLRMNSKRMLSWHLLYGDDSEANQLAGFTTETGAQTYLWSTGATGDNHADAVVKANLKIAGDGLVATVMNKRDWALIQLDKDANKNYVHTRFGPMMLLDMGPGRRFLGANPVIHDDAVIDGDFVSLDMARASELYDQETEEIAFGYINDDFGKNQIHARHDITLVHGILSIYGYVYGQWDGAPS